MEEEELRIGTSHSRASLYLVDDTLNSVNPVGKIVSSIIGSSITALVGETCDIGSFKHYI
jgi:hypothetical protein